MDVDLRAPAVSEEDEETILSSNSRTDVSVVSIRKPSTMNRARLEDLCQHVQCSLSRIYWLLNREKETPLTINHDVVQKVMNQIKEDLLNVLISTLKCGHYESQLAVYPTIKPATLSVILFSTSR